MGLANKCKSIDQEKAGKSRYYKIYCSILNYRLSSWIESNNILCDEPNGFRSGRCTIDHVGSLTSIIETWIKKKSDTFVAFIDFSKAYDRINRELLWYKLARLGISDQFIEVLKSSYHNVQCTTRINDFATEWFDVSVGLKQGCILSPVLFNAFMDDLVQLIRDKQKGVTYGDLNVPILLYADDLLAVIFRAWEICSNPCCGREHGMVKTPAQTMAWCNEKMAEDVIHGQFFFDKENFYLLKEPIKQFLVFYRVNPGTPYGTYMSHVFFLYLLH